MLSQLLGSVISPPSVWGKLPTHADFLQIRVKGEQAQQWQQWLTTQWPSSVVRPPRKKHSGQQVWLNLSAQASLDEACAALPVAFVLGPGQLAFSGSQFVVGVMAPSSDQIGRGHPLVVYQTAQRRWLQQQWLDQEHPAQDWQFWLARLLEGLIQKAWQLSEPGQPRQDMRCTLEAAIDALWAHYHASWRQRLKSAMDKKQDEPMGCESVIRQWVGERDDRLPDVAARLTGVSLFPRSDWPDMIAEPSFAAMYWQQAAQGGYVAAETSLAAIWKDTPSGATERTRPS